MDFFESFIFENVKIKTKDKRLKNFRSEKDIVKFILFNEDLNNRNISIDRDSVKYFIDILHNKKLKDHVIFFNQTNKEITFKISFIYDNDILYEEYLLSFVKRLHINGSKNFPLFIQFKDKKNVLSLMGFEYKEIVIKFKYSILTQCQNFLSKGNK